MKNENIVGIALIGCGGMAGSYRHRYRQIKDARLVLVVDAYEQTAKDAALQLQVDKWSTDFNDCLVPGINIVDISTPNFLHAEQAVAALESGKHVLLQKPIAPTVKEAEDIVSVSKKTGLCAGMYMSLMDNPLYYDVKKLVNDGKLGIITSIHCRSAHRGGLSMPESNWRKSLEKTGGGSFIQLTIHNMNMVQWLLGSKIVKVMAFSKNMLCPNVGGDDITTAACEFDNGVLGTMESAYCAEGDVLSIYGTKGFINIIDNTKIEVQLEEAFKGEYIFYDKPKIKTAFQYPFDMNYLYSSDNLFDQHIAFVKAVQNGDSPPVSVETGLYDLKVVQAVYRSASEKRMIEV